MLLDIYNPKEKKIKKIKFFPLMKYIIFFSVFLIIFLTYEFADTPNKIESFDENFFVGKYEKSKNILRIENATFVGKDKQKQPYTLTAKLAVKESSKENLFMLHFLKADITMEKNNWLILKTNKAIFNTETKILFSNNNVEAFYDDGTSFTSPSMNYNFNNGILNSEEGVVMIGKWGRIKSGQFSYNPIKDVLTFSNDPKMYIYK